MIKQQSNVEHRTMLLLCYFATMLRYLVQKEHNPRCQTQRTCDTMTAIAPENVHTFYHTYDTLTQL